MQQQAPQMMNPAPPAPPNVVSTDQIQKYLDQNKNLIVAIMENQNMGKFAECAGYQAILQKNLMYLAAIADAQPVPGMPSQLPTNPVAQQGNSLALQTQGLTVQQQVQANFRLGGGASGLMGDGGSQPVGSIGEYQWNFGPDAYGGSQPVGSFGDCKGDFGFEPVEGRG